MRKFCGDGELTLLAPTSIIPLVHPEFNIFQPYHQAGIFSWTAECTSLTLEDRRKSSQRPNVLKIVSTLSFMKCCIAFQNTLIRRYRNSWNWSLTSSNRSWNWVTLNDAHRASCQRYFNTTKRNKTFWKFCIDFLHNKKYLQDKQTPNNKIFLTTLYYLRNSHVTHLQESRK